MTVAEGLVEMMVRSGIRTVYGIVGDSANPVVDAIRRHAAGIRFVHVGGGSASG